MKIKAYLGNELISEEEKLNILSVLNDKNLFRYSSENSFSTKVETLSKEIFNSKYSYALINATAALKASLLSLNPTPQDTVVVPSLTFIATSNSVLSSGLIPKLVDVDQTGHLCPEKLKEYLENNKKPAAVIVVHLDGSAAKINEILSICKEYNIPLIEDAAQSLGVKRKNKYIGTFGEFGCLSFQQNKLLSSGEGGLLLSQNEFLFNKAIQICDHGAIRDETLFPNWQLSQTFGENFKITEPISAIIEAQLKKLDILSQELEEKYSELSLLIPDEYLIKRHSEDIKLSFWVENKLFYEKLSSHNIPAFSWQYLDIQNNPIIKNKLSPYANKFPWDNTSNDFCPQSFYIANNRFTLPIFIHYESYQYLKNVLKNL
jgi:dTDP-4-amino-4,6-dideoxygalactose transaminase